jgi:hypothetical protein
MFFSYFNTFSLDLVHKFLNQNIKFTTILDLPNSSQRHHHLMMEYSTGAADSQDYSIIPDMKVLCQRLVSKNKKEKDFISKLNQNFIVVNDNHLLSNIFDTITNNINVTMPLNNAIRLVDHYNVINQCSNSVLQEINEMTWDDIIRYAEQ